MTNSLMQWHLARDNQTKLYRFCDKHAVKRDTELFETTFNQTYYFDNGSFITAELLRGEQDKSHSIDEHFQVVDYGWATQ